MTQEFKRGRNCPRPEGCIDACAQASSLRGHTNTTDAVSGRLVDAMDNETDCDHPDVFKAMQVAAKFAKTMHDTRKKYRSES